MNPQTPHSELLTRLLPPSYSPDGPRLLAELGSEGAALDRTQNSARRLVSATTPLLAEGLLPDGNASAGWPRRWTRPTSNASRRCWPSWLKPAACPSLISPGWRPAWATASPSANRSRSAPASTAPASNCGPRTSLGVASHRVRRQDPAVLLPRRPITGRGTPHHLRRPAAGRPVQGSETGSHPRLLRLPALKPRSRASPSPLLPQPVPSGRGLCFPFPPIIRSVSCKTQPILPSEPIESSTDHAADAARPPPARRSTRSRKSGRARPASRNSTRSRPNRPPYRRFSCVKSSSPYPRRTRCFTTATQQRRVGHHRRRRLAEQCAVRRHR